MRNTLNQNLTDRTIRILGKAHAGQRPALMRVVSRKKCGHMR